MDSYNIPTYPKQVGRCTVCDIPLMSIHRWQITSARGREGWSMHRGHGYCGKHYKRWRKYGDPLADGPRTTATRTRAARPVQIQQCGLCERPMADRRRLDEARQINPEVISTGARGLCRTCYNRAHDSGELEIERFQLSRDIVLDDWAMMRDDGHTDLGMAARRIGMTKRALELALQRARARGDERGSLVPFAHDMRRSAA